MEQSNNKLSFPLLELNENLYQAIKRSLWKHSRKIWIIWVKGMEVFLSWKLFDFYSRLETHFIQPIFMKK